MGNSKKRLIGERMRRGLNATPDRPANTNRLAAAALASGLVTSALPS
jgi:hypothetical protein